MEPEPLTKTKHAEILSKNATSVPVSKPRSFASLDAEATEQTNKLDEYSRNLTRRYVRSVRRAEKALGGPEDSDD